MLLGDAGCGGRRRPGRWRYRRMWCSGMQEAGRRWEESSGGGRGGWGGEQRRMEAAWGKVTMKLPASWAVLYTGTPLFSRVCGFIWVGGARCRCECECGCTRSPAYMYICVRAERACGASSAVCVTSRHRHTWVYNTRTRTRMHMRTQKAWVCMWGVCLCGDMVLQIGDFLQALHHDLLHRGAKLRGLRPRYSVPVVKMQRVHTNQKQVIA